MQQRIGGREAPTIPTRVAGAQGASSGTRAAPGDAYSTRAVTSDVTGLMRWSGALVSLSLVAAMGFWGWKLTVRDVSAVPVVLAIEGPMRVAPDAPGGAAVPHQGLSVNAVQEARGAMPVPDTVRVLDEPENLSDEDLTPAALETPRDRAERTMALVDRLVADAVGAGPAQDVTPQIALAEPDTLVVAGGLGRSLRPVVRPASFSPRVPAAPAVPRAPEIVPGARLVQLGAFDSAEIAQAEWDRLRGSGFAPLLSDKAPIVQQAESGGRTFYRLRAAGFADLDDARRFCAALMAGRAECIPVLAR